MNAWVAFILGGFLGTFAGAIIVGLVSMAGQQSMCERCHEYHADNRLQTEEEEA